MTIEEAIKVIKTERECVSRNDGMNCDRLCDVCDLVLKTEDILTAYDMAVSALVQTGWIPVSERLPEDKYVLISKIPTKLSGNKWSVTIAIRTADPRSRKIQWRDIGLGIIPDDKVLAWMPLPEPYKAESEVEE